MSWAAENVYGWLKSRASLRCGVMVTWLTMTSNFPACKPAMIPLHSVGMNCTLTPSLAATAFATSTSKPSSSPALLRESNGGYVPSRPTLSTPACFTESSKSSAWAATAVKPRMDTATKLELSNFENFMTCLLFIDLLDYTTTLTSRPGRGDS